MNSFQLMAKPTGSICNLDCQYCFYLEKPHLNQRAMTNEVLEAYIKS
ncbi:TPA: anaerobic sulfatase maturase, partial [Haemophilus influenzae]